MRRFLILSLFAFGTIQTDAFAQEVAASADAETEAIESERQHVNAWMVLKVTDRDAAASALIAKAQSLEGYYSSRTDRKLRLKLPRESVKPFLTFAESQGMIADRSFGSKSMSRPLADIGAKLKAREELLEKYFKLLENAGAEAVIAVEKEVIRLVSEIESLKGRQRKVQHQAAFSDIKIDFEFQDRQAPTRDGSSSFQWLNTLNMVDMIKEFQGNYARDWNWCLKADVPKGFAKYDFGSDVRGASSDNALYRVRKQNHSPVASIDFWAEAIENRMKDAGYKVDGEMIALSDTAKLIKVNAPFGNKDYAYWVAFGIDGSKVKIIEAVGELGVLNTIHGENIQVQMTAEFKR